MRSLSEVRCTWNYVTFLFEVRRLQPARFALLIYEFLTLNSYPYLAFYLLSASQQKLE
jgi:hypothetical protein